MARCRAHDLMSVSKRELTPQGYLVAPAVLGRCGVQVYSRGELGLDGDPNAPVRLMRLPEEVFRPETIASFENMPITDDHPPDGVDAASWRSVARGHVRDVGPREGNLLGGRTWVMDGGSVAKVMDGKKSALSCGYTFDLDLTPGTAPDGQAFDGYQRNILGDHLAIVDSPRGGPVCRIEDRKKETSMLKKLVLDGVPLEMEEVQAAVVENLVKGRDAIVADLAAHRTASKKAFAAKDAIIAEKDKAIGEKDKALAAKDGEITELKGKLAKAQAIDVDALVTERSQVIADSKKLAPELEAKGSSHEIRKAVITSACADATIKTIVDKILGSDGIEKATEARVKDAFEVLLALPQQAAIAAQDQRINTALTGNDSNAGGDGEVFGAETKTGSAA